MEYRDFTRLCRRLATVLLMLWAATPAMAERTLVDVAGRTVTVPDQVDRILLGEGRFIPALGILLENPVSPVVATLGDFERFDAPSYAQYRERFPEIDAIPRVGVASADSFNLEQAITMQPQVALFALQGHGPSLDNTALIRRLEASGIPVVFIDFRKAPLENTLPSIEVLGQLLNRPEQARAFSAFYREAMAQVKNALPGDADQHPRVFLHSRVGLTDQCCETMAHGMLGNFVDEAGGRNMAKPLLPGVSGVLNPELLLSEPPEVYVATAIGSETAPGQYRSSVALGPGTSIGFARHSLAQAIEQQKLTSLTPVRTGRAHGIWHHFYNHPFNVVAVQVFARWLHPQQTRELDPGQTLATLFQRFQPVPLDGTYWVDLDQNHLSEGE